MKILRGFAMFVMLLGGCASGGQSYTPTTSYAGQAEAAASVSAPAADYGGAQGGTGDAYAPPSPAQREPRAASEAPRRERPGLGTRFGEDRYAPVQEVSFVRQGGDPAYLATLHYDDRAGIEALRARSERVWSWRDGEPVFRSYRGRAGLWGGLTIRVVDESGRSLPAYHVGERVLVIGEAGRRYALQVENRTSRRFEVVASVDGLDVVDGKPAHLSKRGYVVGPGGRLLIEGYRRSMNEVAAFRFGSVRDSYAAKTAEFGDRHVGVIGVALFAEEGYEPDDQYWQERQERDDEARRREQADPFPGRFAQPPSD
jgi:hypothetical protein